MPHLTQPRHFMVSRRHLLAAGSSLALVRFAPPVLASGIATPRQTEGPFYPTSLPPDADNDLVRVRDVGVPASGQVTYIAGRVRTLDGSSVAGARVEIWQCDAQGIYLHPRSGDQARRDRGFQGFGATQTGADGTYRFRTIRPVPYSGRTPHIHFAVIAPGRSRLVTQMYVAGEPGNERDMVLRQIDPAARRAVLIDLAPAPEAEAGALAGRFDITLG